MNLIKIFKKFNSFSAKHPLRQHQNKTKKNWVCLKPLKWSSLELPHIKIKFCLQHTRKNFSYFSWLYYSIHLWSIHAAFISYAAYSMKKKKNTLELIVSLYHCHEAFPFLSSCAFQFSNEQKRRKSIILAVLWWYDIRI